MDERTIETAADTDAPQKVECYYMSPSEDCVMIGLEVNDRKLRGTMDSGAGRSVIDIGSLETIDPDHEIVSDDSIRLLDASNNVMNILGKCTIRFTIPKLAKTMDHEFIVPNKRSLQNFALK